MAEQVNNVKFLPEIFQTPPNKELFTGSLDVLTNQPDLRRVEGFIGEKYGYGVSPTDKYVVEPTKSRADYQLEPGVVFLKSETQKPEDFINYPGMLSALKLQGALTNDHQRLFNNEFYSWDPLVDYDKIVNYYNWYWIPNGPDAIPITPSIVYTSEDYSVTGDVEGYTFGSVNGTNPAITVLRGGTYSFDVPAGSGNFWIQTVPGVDATVAERTVLGVTNNGTNNGTVSFTVPAKALLLTDVLYYQNGDDPESFGTIHLIETNADNTIYITDIIGKKQYISPTGIVYTDGLKVSFGTDVEPIEYQNKEYYVSGVGEAITLTEVEKYKAVEQINPSELYAPATPQYLTICRKSRDFNAWTRANRWFSKQVVDTTIQFLGEVTADPNNTPIRALRPIIEYRCNMQLFNSGKISLGEVNIVDTTTTDAFTDIEGKTVAEVGTVDGVYLYDNCKIIFTADSNPAVRQNIYIVKLVPAGPSGDVISLVQDLLLPVVNTVQVYISQGTNQKGTTWWYNESVSNWVVGQKKTTTNQYPLFDIFDADNHSLSDNQYYSSSTFRGTKLFSYTPGTGANDPVLGFPIAYNSSDTIGDILFTVNLNSDTFTYNTPVEENILTNVNVGFVHWYETATTIQNLTGWIPAAGESIQYQVFEFPLITTYQYSSSNTSITIESGGSGYAVGDQLKILGTYFGGTTPENDLIFTVSSVSGSTITGISPASIKGDSITVQGIFTNIQVDRNTGLGTSALVSIIISDPGTTTFTCDIPASLDTPWRNVVVYYNDNVISPNEYKVTIDNVNKTTSVTVTSEIGAKITALVVSDYVSKTAYYTVPSNLENNPFNTNITSVAVGDIRNQYLSIFSNAPGVTGTAYGKNNLSTLGNVYKYGTAIIQNSASLILPGVFMRKPQANIFDALKYSSEQYQIYKNLIVDLVSKKDYSIYTPPSVILNDVLFNITSSKKNESAFFWTDMIFSGNPYSQNSYSIGADTTNSTFSVSDVWSPTLFTQANYNGVGVYVTRLIDNRQITFQLLKNVDYQVSTITPSLTINYQLLAGDVVTVKQYNQTYGSYCPATPSKLGLYPIFIPGIVTILNANDPSTFRYWLRGHDGSINRLYGDFDPVTGLLSDFRDQVLLEFEQRVYNNYKVSGPIPLQLDDVMPGEFRTTEYTWEEILEIYSVGFLNWIGKNKLDYKTQYYVSTNKFTYNYNQTSDKLTNDVNKQGYWKGLYNWLYDSSNPAAAPWELLGFVDQPSWWITRYGPAPYTSGNTLMWSEIAAGYVWNDGTPYINTKKIRPGLLQVLPVDTLGNLLSPFDTIMGNYSRLTFNRDWRVGDGAPVENAYLTGSAWPFDLMRLLALTKPAKFFSLFVDRDLYKYNDTLVTPGQYLYNNRYHLDPRTIVVYGNGTPKHSYINFVVDYINQYGSNGTDTITNYLKNLDVRLIYNMAGFTAKNYLKFLVEKATPNSQNNSLLIPDESYTVLLYDNPPAEKITFSSVIVQKVDNGYSVWGNSKSTQYFTVQVPKPGFFKTITTNGTSLQVSTNYSDKTTIIPYGTVFYSVQGIAEFLQSYGEYMTRQGVVFDNISAGSAIDWQTMIQEFTVWSNQGWETGSVIQLNPNAREFVVNREGLVVQPLSLHEQNFMLNQNLLPIQAQDAAINRDGTAFSVKILNPGDTIALANLNLSSIEHAIVFDNETAFNDTVYNLTTGLRQPRLLLKGYKSGNWTGWMNANGFIINQHNVKEWAPNVKYPKDFIVKFKNKYYTAATLIEPSSEFSKENWLEADYSELTSELLPNPSTVAYEAQWYYDTNRANLENDADLLAFSLIGYRPRDYLAAADLSDITQINVYQNIIKTKGTKQLADSFKGLTFDQGSIDYNIQENWAIKQGQFGAVLNRNYVEAVLQQNLLTGNPTVVGFNNSSSSIEGAQQTVDIANLINWGRPPLTQYFLPLYNNSYDVETGVATAGYVNLDDTKIQKYYFSDLTGINDAVKTLYRGDNVWLANYKNSWDIFTAASLDNEIVSVSNNLNGTINLKFLNFHNLIVDDLIAVINVDSRVNGFYAVKAIKDLFTITVSLALDPNVQTIACKGTGFKLVTRRFEQPSDAANSLIPYSQWGTRKIWADFDKDNQWAVYGASPVFRESRNYQVSGSFGVSVAYSENCGQLIADGAGNIHRYKNGTYQLITGVGIGTNTKLVANENYVYCSSPDEGCVYVYQYVPVTDSLLFSQKIVVVPNLANVTGAIAVGTDAQWMFVADSVNQQIAVYALNNLFLNYTFVTVFNDPSVPPGSGWGSSLATSVDGVKLVVGAPNENIGLYTSAGAVYVYSRFVQSYLADGVTTAYTMSYASPLNTVDVYINDVLETTCAASANGTLLTVYTLDPITDVLGPAPIGTLISVSTGYIFAVQRFQSDDPKIGGLFGNSVDTNRYGSDIIVGCPFEITTESNNQNIEGAVYRYTNAGQRYGVITTTVTGSKTGTIFIDGFVVFYSGTINQIAQNINNQTPTNIIATAVGSTLTITYKEDTPEWLYNLIDITGQPADLAAIGIIPYTQTQKILNVDRTNVSEFGYQVKMDEQDSFVVSAIKQYKQSPTTFDYTTNCLQDDTIFDNDTTIFVDKFSNQGVVYNYSYLPAHNESIDNPGKYAFGQYIDTAYIASEAPSPQFGYALAYYRSVIMVSTPYWGTSGGGASTFTVDWIPEYPDCEVIEPASWYVDKKPLPVVDINALSYISIYNLTTNETLEYLDYIDPVQGKILGAVATNLNYTRITDPAVYSTTGLSWKVDHVGDYWLDLNSIRVLNYHQPDVSYNAKNWGKAFPGSTADVYTWIESSVPPVNYPGPGFPKSFDKFTTATVVDGSTNSLVTKYYFWVKNYNVIPNGKTLSPLAISAYMLNPLNSGIAFLAPITTNIVGLFNCGQAIQDNTSVLHLGYGIPNTDDDAHTTWSLIQEGDPEDFLSGFPSTTESYPSGLYLKFIESFAGWTIDGLGVEVPDPKLPLLARYGTSFRPVQSMFIDRLLALENYITYANNIMIKLPIIEMRNLSYLNTFGFLFDTRKYWEIVNWWAPGYSDSTKADIEVSNYNQLLTITNDESFVGLTGVALTLQDGLIAKVTSNNYGNAEYYVYSSTTSPNWTRIGAENTTLQILSSLWTKQFGWSSDPWDNIWDANNAIEVSYVIRWINEVLYTNELLVSRNLSLCLMFKFIQSESLQQNNYLPWLNKTSLIDVQHRIRSLLPYKNYQRDNQEFLSGFLNEIKPFHVYIKDFVYTYNGLDVYQGNITDFDLPSSYNFTVGKNESPQIVYDTPNNSNEYTVSDVIWKEEQYNQWFNNYGLSISVEEDSLALTSLRSTLNAVDTTLYVDVAYGFPVQGTIIIQDEIISYTGVDIAAKALTGLTRGIDGTVSAVHNAGTEVAITIPPVIVYNTGRGYTEPPKITAYINTAIYPEPRVSAVLAPIMSGETLTGISVIEPGSGYAITPEIVIEGSSIAATFSNANVNISTNEITITGHNFVSGDSVVYSLGSATTGPLGLTVGDYYYVGVIDANTIALYESYENATLTILDPYYHVYTADGRVQFGTTGSGLNNIITVTARATCISSDRPIRDFKISLKFDRTSYTVNLTEDNAASRIEEFYDPATAMPGKELDQLMNGIEYPNAVFKAAAFNLGWDGEHWDIVGWDGPSDNPTTDTYLKDLYFPTNPAEAANNFYDVKGSPFVSGYGPEEMVPGYITDILSFNVISYYPDAPNPDIPLSFRIAKDENENFTVYNTNPFTQTTLGAPFISTGSYTDVMYVDNISAIISGGGNVIYWNNEYIKFDSYDIPTLTITGLTRGYGGTIVNPGTVSSPVTYPGGAITVGNLVPGTFYTITIVGTTDFTLAGAPANEVGVTFYADSNVGVLTGTGEVRVTVQSVQAINALGNTYYNQWWYGAPSSPSANTTLEANTYAAAVFLQKQSP